MSVAQTAQPRPPRPALADRLLPDLRMGLDNLFVNKLRSMLTMLGMICGGVIATLHQQRR